MSREADVERIARVLCQSQGIGPDVKVLRQRTPYMTTFGAFDIIDEHHKPELGWQWFIGPAYAILQDGWVQPASTAEAEPEGVVDPQLPGFDINPSAPATLKESWQQRMGLA